MNFRLCFFLYACLVLFKISNVVGSGGSNGSPKNNGNAVATNRSLKKDHDETYADDEDGMEGSGVGENPSDRKFDLDTAGSGFGPDEDDADPSIFPVVPQGGSKEKSLPDGSTLTSRETELLIQTSATPLSPQQSPSPPPQESHPELPPTSTNTRTISDKQPTDGKLDQNNNSKNKNENTVRTNTIESFTPGDNGGHNDIGVHSINNQDKDKTISFFAQPGILAAVIGGAVVGLLCAILVVMFIVYRMRKKDEGSYALEEMKRSPASNPYMKTNHREFFA